MIIEFTSVMVIYGKKNHVSFNVIDEFINPTIQLLTPNILKTYHSWIFNIIPQIYQFAPYKYWFVCFIRNMFCHPPCRFRKIISFNIFVLHSSEHICVRQNRNPFTYNTGYYLVLLLSGNRPVCFQLIWIHDAECYGIKPGKGNYISL